MTSPTKVAIVGATGKTGASVINGLLASEDKFEITAFARESSLESTANQSLRDRGVRVIAVDLNGPRDVLVEALTGIEVVVSCIVFLALKDQIPLTEAAKKASVKRFVPCNFGTPAPRGIMWLDDQKYDVLDAIQRIYLPYTVIDVGWWAEQMVPLVPSGRTDHGFQKFVGGVLPGDGSVLNAFTSLSDVGKYVAKIITDPRTINQKVLAFTDLLTVNQAFELMDELSGEEAIRKHLSAEEIQTAISEANEVLKTQPEDGGAWGKKAINEYFLSWGVRGDNQPESAKYLGYLNFKELYPDVRGRSLRTVYQEVLDGKPNEISH